MKSRIVDDDGRPHVILKDALPMDDLIESGDTPYPAMNRAIRSKKGTGDAGAAGSQVAADGSDSD